MRRLAVAGVGGLVVLLLMAGPAGAFLDQVELPRARRGVVTFPHRKHADDYGIPCARCHHNMSVIRAEQPTCRGCHMNPAHQGLCHDCHVSNRDKDFAERYARLKEKLGVERLPTLFKAFHGSCRGCHAQVNRAEGKKAPYECGGCHKG